MLSQHSVKTYLLMSGLLALSTLCLAPQVHADGAKPASHAAQAAAQTSAPVDGVVNLNTASVEELDRLPGVGPSRAQAIIALRTHLKHFERVEDVMRVKGIGRAMFRKLRPMLTLQGPTTLPEKAAHARRPNAPAAS
jgi:competence protein ComEA